MTDRKAEQVRQLALFSECSPADVEWICSAADSLDVPAGQVLALEDATVREVVVVMDGVAAAGDGVGDVLLGRGAYFGATELVAGRRCPMTIESLTQVRLLVFGVRQFRALLDRVPSVHARISAAPAQPPEADRSLRAVS